MDQRELVRQLEAHFRAEDEKLHEQMRKSRQEQDSLSDEEWWARIVSDTASIRPFMLEVFERNKEEMIKNRYKRLGSEEGFREKNIQQKVMELLPYVAAYRSETDANGDLSTDEIYVATMRKSSEVTKSAMAQFEAGKSQIENPKKRAMLDLFIEDANIHESEMEQFRDPANLTEEKWDAFSVRLTERLDKFMERTKEISERNPEELN
jgi:hypothetical protein